MQKKNLIIVCFLLASLVINKAVVAQKNLRYKNVYKTVLENTREEAYSMLLIFQKQDPFFPNTYFQLGLIAEYWSKDYDALTNIRDVRFFIYNTKLYFGLAKSKIDDKEVRKNDEYYVNTERFKGIDKLKFEDVNFFINDQLDANTIYEKNVEIIINYYNSSINHYNNCIKIFKEINSNNRKIKDIYMTADKDFLSKLDELKNSFDSTIYNLQNYQTAIKNYPIKEHRQKYKLYKIKTYRLHGLTNSNFLDEEIHLWDFGTWVKDLKTVLNSDIERLRRDIDLANNKLDKRINTAEKSTYKNDFKNYVVDEKLINRIGKYDYNSLMVPLFKYKVAKLDFYIKSKNPINNVLDTTVNYTILQKGKYYNELVKKKQFADSLKADFYSRINSYDINKYKTFFELNYDGELGLKSAFERESIELNLELNKAYDSFKKFLIKKLLYQNRIVTLPYKKSSIDLEIVGQAFTDANLGEYYVTSISKDNAGNYYASGYIKQRNPGVSAFVLKTNNLFPHLQ